MQNDCIKYLIVSCMQFSKMIYKQQRNKKKKKGLEKLDFTNHLP